MIELEEGQFKIGDMLFGAGTDIKVSTFKKESYEVQTADLPVARSDEIRFGRDSFTATAITFEMSVIDNYSIFEGPEVAVGDYSGSELQEMLATEWRADRERRVWNSQKPLYYCKRGIQKVVYGRPRKFTPGFDRYGSEFIPIVAEYQPVDPLSYDANEKGVTVPVTADGVMPGKMTRIGGNVGAWCRFILNGPINVPVIELGNGQKITVNYNLPSGVVLEVSSYPWERRVVTSTGYTLAAYLINDSPYLDEISLPPNSTTTFGLHESGATKVANANTNLIALYREAYATL